MNRFEITNAEIIWIGEPQSITDRRGLPLEKQQLLLEFPTDKKRGMLTAWLFDDDVESYNVGDKLRGELIFNTREASPGYYSLQAKIANIKLQ